MRSKSNSTVLVALMVMALLFMAEPADAYTAKWNPVYHDYTLMGGTAITTAPSAMIDAPIGYGIIMDTLQMAVHVWCDTLTITSGTAVYDPIIYCLDNSIGVTLGIPQAVNSTTYINYPAADSTTLQVPGRWRSFIISCQATADSTAAHGYVVIGRTQPAVTLTRPH